MKIYFSGISGVGIGPLAEFAHDAGHEVFGSDMASGQINHELSEKGIEYHIGEQDGEYLQQIYDENDGLDWFIHTSALPVDHPELKLAEKLGIRTGKRDTLLPILIREHGLKLIAIAGTSGKTTTTNMMTWAMIQNNIPVSYLNGSTVPYGYAGKYDPKSKYLVYECDEFDRNFLAYHPYLSLITSVAYDHAEIYHTEEEYYDAFAQFVEQSFNVIGWEGDPKGHWDDADNYTSLTEIDNRFTLDGEVNRKDATLVLAGLHRLGVDQDEQIIHVLNNFPGTGRRFEELIPNLYSDYAHLPEELMALLQKAREVADRQGKKVAIVYEPLQNMRQYQIRSQYNHTFDNADRVLWVPTFCIPGREDDRPELKPAELITEMADPEKASPADLNDKLITDVKQLIADNYIVIVAAGGKTADKFFREHVAQLS